MSALRAKSLTCKICHQRKVRCDGLNPCGSCSRARKPLVCEYIAPSAGNIVELPKGAACLQCRKRKRKCDGGRPCLTCKDTSHSDACEHRDIRRDQGTTPKASSQTTISAPVEFSSAAVERTPSQVDHSLESITNTTARFNAVVDALLTIPQLPNVVEVDLATELSSVRNLFLTQCWYYGLNISAEKRAAIACGDSSGSVVHPVFIPLCQLIGYLQASQREPEHHTYVPTYWTDREAVQLSCVLMLLDTPANSQTPDPLTLVQVYMLLALYFAQRKNYQKYHELLGSASNIALRHHTELGFDDSSPLARSGLPQGPLEEGRSALAQLVYLEVVSKIIMKETPKVPPVILARFCHLATQNIEEIELNFVRARVALLLAQSQELAAEWIKSVEPDSMVGKEWCKRWMTLETYCQLQLKVLTKAVTERPSTLEIPLLLLESCNIVVLAALAELYSVFAPFHAVGRKKHSGIIQSIADTSRRFTPEDHQHFDCTLETCWEIASRDIPDSTTATPQWHMCFANVVLMGGLEPSPLVDPEALVHCA
ncbi:hypothetical protein K438DRAFT_1819054 [Mycena galopus ATCC 62051]|nr:hypothetical protein K438DRAFT_1819054 [Mycena galopus ATCC 62051]